MEQFQEGLGEAWTNIATLIPTIIAFLLVLIIGYFVAKGLAKALERVLEGVGFDGWVERGGIERALAQSKYDASGLLSKLVFYVIMLFVLQLGFGLFGPNPISELITAVIGYLPRIFVAILIVVIGSAVASAVRDLVQGALGGMEYGRMLAMLASGAILVITAFAALNQLQIAPAIVTGLFYALLAIIVGSAVVAFGGGGIPIARRYIAEWTKRAEDEADRVSEDTRDERARVGAGNGEAGAEPSRQERVGAEGSRHDDRAEAQRTEELRAEEAGSRPHQGDGASRRNR